MFVALLVSTTLYVTVRALVEARGFVGLAMWTNTARNATAVPLQIVLAIPLGLGLGAAGMAYGYALGTLLVVPVVAYYARVWITTPSVETLRSLWSYAKYSIPSGFVGKVYSRFDLILLGVLIGPAAVANYEIAFRISMPATFISITAASVLMAKVSHSATSGESIKDDIVSTLSYASLLSVPIFFGAVVIADDLVVVLYGGAYAEAGLFLVGLAFYRILRSQTSPLKNVVNGLDRPDYNLRLSTVVLAINIVLGIAFVFEIGAIGIVIATVIAEAIRYLGLIWFLRQSNPGISLFPRPLQAQIGAGFLMCLFVFAFVETVPFDRTVTTGFAVFSGALVYAAFLLAGSQYHRGLARSGVDRLL